MRILEEWGSWRSGDEIDRNEEFDNDKLALFVPWRSEDLGGVNIFEE